MYKNAMEKGAPNKSQIIVQMIEVALTDGTLVAVRGFSVDDDTDIFSFKLVIFSLTWGSLMTSNKDSVSSLLVEKNIAIESLISDIIGQSCFAST